MNIQEITFLKDPRDSVIKKSWGDVWYKFTKSFKSNYTPGFFDKLFGYTDNSKPDIADFLNYLEENYKVEEKQLH